MFHFSMPCETRRLRNHSILLRTSPSNGRLPSPHPKGLFCAPILTFFLFAIPGFFLPEKACGQCDYSETGKITAANAAPAEFFGSSVASDGRFSIVGAYGNGRLGSSTGIAHLYRFNGNAWVHHRTLVGSDSFGGDRFGFSVGVSGTTAIVGAPLDVHNLVQSGSAYLFQRNGNDWIEIQKLVPPDGNRGDVFGRTVAISGPVAVVGARQADAIGSDSGAVYVYRFVESSWQLDQILVASDGDSGDFFGTSIAIDGETIVVGADAESRGTGAAYVFRYTGGMWVQERKLLASDGTLGDRFGTAVAVDEPYIAISAPNRCCLPDRPPAVYVFRRDSGGWVQETALISNEPSTTDDFGLAVAIDERRISVGAKKHTAGGRFTGAVLTYIERGQGWQPDQILIPSEGLSADAFGSSIASSDTVLIVGADFDDDHGSASGSAYLYSQTGAAALGTVNTANGPPHAVLHLNGEAGNGLTRIVEYDVLGAFELEMRLPPALPEGSEAPFALYIWGRVPTPRDGRALPFGIGCTAMPTPLSGGNPQPTVIFNNAGRFARLGRPTHPSRPAPRVFLRRPNGLGQAVTFYLQGIIFDPGSSAAVPASVTNGILAQPVFNPGN